MPPRQKASRNRVSRKALLISMDSVLQQYYNSERLHSAIWYLTPNDVFNARTEKRLAERKEKWHTAFINRQEYWRVKNTNAAS